MDTFGRASAVLDDDVPVARRTETRLALVMNGGVSLAVWMGGVTHELELLRRASRGLRDGVDGADLPVFRIWERLAAAAGTELDVDIVAGTSAGGLNGMLLATALARNAHLPDLRKLWEESAGLPALLDPAPVGSVLNGETFRDRIDEAMAHIGPGDGNGRPVTLFLTSTALDGANRLCEDGFGTPFEVRDHRRLYWFRHGDLVTYERQDDTPFWEFDTEAHSDFRGPENECALVDAARATAAFPVAFTAVDERNLLRFRIQPSARRGGTAAPVMDGGVLNNEPFDPVLEAVTRRRLDRPVRRVVMYVVPSAGRTAQEATQGRAPEHIPWSTAAVNALRYPAESNFRAATDELSSRLWNNLRDIQLDLFERMADKPRLREHIVRTAHLLLPEYRRNRALAVIEEVRHRATGSRAVDALVAETHADGRGIDAILGHDAAPGWVEPNWTPRWDGRELDGPWTAWRWGLAAAERTVELLTGHLHEVADALGPEQSAALLAAADATSALRMRVLAVVDALHAELAQVGKASLTDPETAALIQELFARLDVPHTLARIVAEAGARYTSALRDAGAGPGWTAQEAVTAALSVELVTRVYAPPAKIVEPSRPTFSFLRLGPDRTSPLFDDADFPAQRDRKLFGIRFGHFGAFAAREWRTSDFAWGRLDAALHLLDLLGIADPEVARELHLAILTAEVRKGTPPGTPPPDAVAWMRENLRVLRTTEDGKLALDYARSPEGREAVQDTVLSVMRMLDARDPEPGPPKGLALAKSYGRTVFVRHKDRGELASGERRLPLRLLTAHMRNRFWRTFDRSPVDAPKALAGGARDTAVAIGVLAAVGALALAGGLAFGVYVLIRWLIGG